MAVHVIVQINITNPERFSEYWEKVPPQIAKNVGRDVIRGAEVEYLESDS